MDCWGDYLALGLDSIVFGICAGLYRNYVISSSLVEKAHRLGINPHYDDLSSDDKFYVAYQGEVKALGKPINSFYSSDTTGVIQRITIREHAIARNSSGFWSDQKNTIQESYNVVPFVLARGQIVLQIVDPLDASVLDLDTVYNKFEPSKSGLMDSFIGFFNGVRQRGIETTEEMMKEGAVITAIGQVTKDSQGLLQLSASSQGHPFYLTSTPITSLMRKLDEEKRTYKWLTYLFGSIGLYISYLIFKKWWEDRKKRIQDEEIKKRLEESRSLRRKKAREGQELQENERCVVCRDNPKEIILLPCGHVCICEDCSGSINKDCPICRSPINNKQAAFIS